VYQLLSESRLVTSKTRTDETTQEFKNLLDLVLPKNEDEREFEHYIRASFKRARAGFMATLPGASNKHRAVVLLTDPITIVHEFGVQDLIYIKYDPHTNEYAISESQFSQHRPSENNESYRILSRRSQNNRNDRNQNDRTPDRRGRRGGRNRGRNNRQHPPVVANPELTQKLNETVTSDVQPQNPQTSQPPQTPQPTQNIPNPQTPQSPSKVAWADMK
jgi:hypothetical protein